MPCLDFPCESSGCNCSRQIVTFQIHKCISKRFVNIYFSIGWFWCSPCASAMMMMMSFFFERWQGRDQGSRLAGQRTVRRKHAFARWKCMQCVRSHCEMNCMFNYTLHLEIFAMCLYTLHLKIPVLHWYTGYQPVYSPYLQVEFVQAYCKFLSRHTMYLELYAKHLYAVCNA